MMTDNFNSGNMGAAMGQFMKAPTQQLLTRHHGLSVELGVSVTSHESSRIAVGITHSMLVLELQNLAYNASGDASILAILIGLASSHCLGSRVRPIVAPAVEAVAAQGITAAVAAQHAVHGNSLRVFVSPWRSH